jgi:hypothetical protein
MGKAVRADGFGCSPWPFNYCCRWVCSRPKRQTSGGPGGQTVDVMQTMSKAGCMAHSCGGTWNPYTFDFILKNFCLYVELQLAYLLLGAGAFVAPT